MFSSSSSEPFLCASPSLPLSPHTDTHPLSRAQDMGKIEAGKLDIEIRAFDLNELSSDARFFSTAAKKKGLEFIEDVDSFPVEVMGYVQAPSVPFSAVLTLLPRHSDMPRLRQVVANLLANAIKFTKEGAITLRVKKVEEDENSIKVQWQVQDTGVGIRKEAAAMLFQPFRQADISTSREFGGTGLGLSISKSVRRPSFPPPSPFDLLLTLLPRP